MNKVSINFDEAVAPIQDGATIMVGGFGLCGIPQNLIQALHDKNVKDLTIISNNCGTDDEGLGILLKNGQIKKIIASYVGENKVFEKMFLEGSLEVELTPQGTLAEKIRAGGAGIPAFFTPAGVGTQIAENKEIKVFKGREYILEESLTSDFSLVKAWKADEMGNLIYRKTADAFNSIMATAGSITLAEVEEIVPVGSIDPNHIHTPSIYVKKVLKGEYDKKIERLMLRNHG